LGAALAAVAAPAAAAERVVFCDKPPGVCAHPLGTSMQRGAWALVDDRELESAVTGGEPLPLILYLSRGEYDEAVAGLDAKERERAVLRRAKVLRDNGFLAPDVLWLDLRSVAAASRRGANDLVLVLEAAVAMSGGAKRYSGGRSADALSELRTSIATLQVELAGGPVAAGYAKEAEALGWLSGQPHVAPFAAPIRVYFVPRMRPPPGPDGELGFDFPSFGWHGGTLLSLRPDEAAEPRWKSRHPRLMYLDPASFMRDLSLTDRQIDRRLRARFAHPRREEQAEIAAALAFTHAISLRLYKTVIRESSPDLLATFDEIVALDDENLRLALAAAEPHAAGDLEARAARLRADLALARLVLRGAPGKKYEASVVDQAIDLIARLPGPP
jgi:hypothetical protein